MAIAQTLSALREIVDVEQLRKAFHSATGKGVRIAVLDSGVDGEHPAFAGRVKAQFDVVTDRMGARCVPAKLSDSIGHGTACAGIILQVAPEAELYSVQVIGSEARGTAEQLIAALSFALDQGYDVINMSLGTTDERITRRLGVLTDRAFYDGRIIVAAANNLGQVAFPARFFAAVPRGRHGEASENPRIPPLRPRHLPIEVAARNRVCRGSGDAGGGTQLLHRHEFRLPARHRDGGAATVALSGPDGVRGKIAAAFAGVRQRS